jgi:TRAP transporter TAXI family solute receptor
MFPEIEVTVVETGGGADNIELLRDHEIDWAHCSECALGYSAMEGLFEYEGTSFPDVRSFWSVGTTPQTLFVSEASGITDITQLEGKKFGSRAGSFDGRTNRLFFEAIGITPDWTVAKAGALIDAFMGRSIIGWTKSGAPDAGILQCTTAVPCRLIPIPPELVDQANEVYPGQFMKGVVPAGSYPGQTEDIPTIAITNGDGCLAEVPEEAAYKIVKANMENCDAMNEAHKAFNPAEPWSSNNKPWESTLELALIPLHPGAIRYYEEIGLKVPDRLIPPEMK